MDIIQRILQGYFGIDVFHVMGMTDIDDKIILKGALDGKDTKEIALKYESEFLDDMSRLGVMFNHQK